MIYACFQTFRYPARAAGPHNHIDMRHILERSISPNAMSIFSFIRA